MPSSLNAAAKRNPVLQKRDSIKTGWLAAWRRRVRRWALKRRPAQSSFVLDRNNLFIFPTGAGFALLLVIFLMWLLGTNYDNNLVLALAFLLASILISCILHTHASLAGLKIEVSKLQEGFAGDELGAEIRLSRQGKRKYHDVRLFWAGQYPKAVTVDQADASYVSLSINAVRRGIIEPPLLCVESRYPLGLLRCWAWLKFDTSVLVYPKPVEAGPLPATASDEGSGDSEPVLLDGAEDFSGFHSYRDGESLKHVSWKHYAQGKGMFVKDFQSYADEQLWVDWDALPGMDREARLQRLCDWLLILADGSQPFGMRLPGQTIAPATGMSHRLNCLRALANFEANQLASLSSNYYLEGKL